MLRSILLGAVLMGVCSPLMAAQTDWQEVLPDVRMRLVAMPYFGSGHEIAAAIEIDMPATHKTYWRIPGASGFAATLDASTSQHVLGVEQLWPLPTVEVFKGETDYVYRGHTFLPFSIAPAKGADVVLDVSAFLGICAELCMPVSANFSARLDDKEPESVQAFAQSLTGVPEPWPYGESPIRDVTAFEGGISLRIADDAGVEPDSLVASTEDGTALGAARGGDRILLPSAGGRPLHKGDRVVIAFRAGPGTYSVEAELL